MAYDMHTAEGETDVTWLIILDIKIGDVKTSPLNTLWWSDCRTIGVTSIKNQNFFVNVFNRNSGVEDI